MNSDFPSRYKPRKATMMDVVLKTHKETSFGWLLALQQLWAALRAPSPPRKYPRLIAPR
jgi:hypothetical protein